MNILNLKIKGMSTYSQTKQDNKLINNIQNVVNDLHSLNIKSDQEIIKIIINIKKILNIIKNKPISTIMTIQKEVLIEKQSQTTPQNFSIENARDKLSTYLDDLKITINNYINQNPSIPTLLTIDFKNLSKDLDKIIQYNLENQKYQIQNQIKTDLKTFLIDLEQIDLHIPTIFQAMDIETQINNIYKFLSINKVEPNQHIINIIDQSINQINKLIDSIIVPTQTEPTINHFFLIQYPQYTSKRNIYKIILNTSLIIQHIKNKYNLNKNSIIQFLQKIEKILQFNKFKKLYKNLKTHEEIKKYFNEFTKNIKHLSKVIEISNEIIENFPNNSELLNLFFGPMFYEQNNINKYNFGYGEILSQISGHLFRFIDQINALINHYKKNQIIFQQNLQILQTLKQISLNLQTKYKFILRHQLCHVLENINKNLELFTDFLRPFNNNTIIDTQYADNIAFNADNIAFNTDDKSIMYEENTINFPNTTTTIQNLLKTNMQDIPSSLYHQIQIDNMEFEEIPTNTNSGIKTLQDLSKTFQFIHQYIITTETKTHIFDMDETIYLKLTTIKHNIDMIILYASNYNDNYTMQEAQKQSININNIIIKSQELLKQNNYNNTNEQQI